MYLTPPLCLQVTLNTWCVPLLQRCEEYLSTMVQTHRDTPTTVPAAAEQLSDEAEQEAIRYLFTLGEVAQVSLTTFTIYTTCLHSGKWHK